MQSGDENLHEKPSIADANAKPREALQKRVTDSFENTENERLKLIMKSLVKHLHGFVSEVNLTTEEWQEAIQFLTSVGQSCTPVRQEFILLSDVLGVSSLVDIVNNSTDDRATEPTILGPFYIENMPILPTDSSIVQRPLDGSVPIRVFGRVMDVEGIAIAGAILDVWQTDSNGLYDIQESEQDITGNLRGRFVSDENGCYSFRSVRPVSYQVPGDGPVGQMLRAVNRHCWRAAHIHAIASANGFKSVTTHIFDSKCPYLQADTVFGVKDSLICEFIEQDDGSAEVEFNFILNKL